MKHLSTLLLAITLSTTAFAQDYKYELGMQGGPNLTKMRFTFTALQSTTHPQVAGGGGLFLQYNINKTFSLRIDPTLDRLATTSGKNALTDANGNIIRYDDLHYHYDYLSIPLLFRAGIGHKVRYFLNIGPSFNFLLNQKLIIKGYDPKPIITNNTNQYQAFNFGIVTGLGIAIPIKERFSLSFELRNNYGLSNINKNTDKSFSIKTNSTSLLIGFAYKFGAK
jgi:hypothetical protein